MLDLVHMRVTCFVLQFAKYYIYSHPPIPDLSNTQTAMPAMSTICIESGSLILNNLWIENKYFIGDNFHKDKVGIGVWYLCNVAERV